MELTKKRIMLCIVLCCAFISFVIYKFWLIKDWTRIGMVSACGVVFFTILYMMMYYRRNIKKFFFYGISCLMIIGIAEASMYICNVNNLSTSFRYGRIIDQFKTISLYGYSIINRLEGEAKSISPTCKDFTSFKNRLSRTIFFSLLNDKIIYVQKEVENDYRIKLLTSSVSHQTINIGHINDGIIDGLYDSRKKERITIEYKTGAERSIVILKGDEWEQSESIFIFADHGGDIWLIPQMAIREDCFCRCENEINPNVFGGESSSEIRKIIWERNEGFPKTYDSVISFNNYKAALCGFIYLIYLSIIGCLIQSFISIPSIIGILMSLPFGIIVEILSCIILGLFHLPISLENLIVISLIIPGVIQIIRKKDLVLRFLQNKFLIKEFLPSRNVVGLIGFQLIVYAFFSMIPVWNMGGDTTLNLSLSWLIAYRQEWGSLFPAISALSLFMPFVGVGSALFKVDTPYYLLPSLSFVSISTIGYVVSLENNNKWNKLLICLSTAFVISTPIFLLNSVSIMNNLPIGFYLGISMALILSKRNFDSQYLFGGIFLIFACCVRIEMPLYGVLILFILCQVIETRVIKRYALILLAFSVGLYILNYIHFNPKYGDFWTPVKGGAVLLAIFLGVMFFYFENRINKMMLYKIRVKFVLLSMVVFPAMFGIFFDYKKLIGNLNAYWQNTLYSGYYGSLWLIIGMLIIFVFSVSNRCNRSLILAEVLLVFFLLGFDIMCFRQDPIKFSYGDSSARMLLHILPSVALFIVYLWEDIRESLEIKITST